MNEIQCPCCKGRDLWSEKGKAVPCKLCGWDGVVTMEAAVIYLLEKVEQLENLFQQRAEKGAA